VPLHPFQALALQLVQTQEMLLMSFEAVKERVNETKGYGRMAVE
jgi:hypothetical protein